MSKLIKQAKFDILNIQILLLIFISSCIEPFTLEMKNQSQKYVVYGQLTDLEGYQTVSVSRSSTLNSPKFDPLSNCTVRIVDTLGNEFNLIEFEKGDYRVWIDQTYLKPGNSYKVFVTTESGLEFSSDFDKMPESIEIDTIFYIREDKLTRNLEKPLQGIQFYVDLDASNTNSHYFRWELTETWEHHSTYPQEYRWFARKKYMYRFIPVDWSKYCCWTTQRIPQIFIFSTENSTENIISKYKLHYVDNQTQRLNFGYSLLIKQFTISKPTWNYWNNLQINSENRGNLYEIQPLHFKGNIVCSSNPNIEVLGYFSATTMRSKRIFIKHVENLPRYFPPCGWGIIDKGMLTQDFYAAYIWEIGGTISAVEDSCVLCDFYNGTTTKPDFWPY